LRMRVVIQRVRKASVVAGGELKGEIGLGAVLLLGVTHGDSESDADSLADRCIGLRVFEDADGKMNLSCRDVGGEFLVVPQFTLYGDTRRGRRPSFTDAAEPVIAEKLFERFVRRTSEAGINVATGCFGRKMLVQIENDGPVTFIIDSKPS
jgi:D-tyrosyl-tRNA(Tyr) deacylase